MTRSFSSLTGTAETTDRPREPLNVSVKDFPAAAREKGPTTRLPICRGSLWVRVTPSSVYTLMPSTPAIFRAACALGCRMALGSGLRRAATMPGDSANVPAAASVRCRASSMASLRACTTSATTAAATRSTTTTSWRRNTSPATLRALRREDSRWGLRTLPAQAWPCSCCSWRSSERGPREPAEARFAEPGSTRRRCPRKTLIIHLLTSPPRRQRGAAPAPRRVQVIPHLFHPIEEGAAVSAPAGGGPRGDRMPVTRSAGPEQGPDPDPGS